MKVVCKSLAIVMLFAVFFMSLIPGLHTDGSSSKVQISKNQFRTYAQALLAFEQECGNFPLIFDDYGRINLSELLNSERFFIAMTGRGMDGNRRVLVAQNLGNSRVLPFFEHSYVSTENVDELGRTTIVDAHGNPSIWIVVDHDADGRISIPIGSGFSVVDGRIAVFSASDESEKTVGIIYRGGEFSSLLPG